MKHYDLAVIGTGSGNSIVNRQFADQRVAILEENVFGGTCLNVGCIPTKMFVHPADLARDARHAPELGVDTSYDGVRWREIRDRVFGRIDPIGQQDRANRERRDNIDVFDGHATFLDDHTLDTGTGEQITATQIVVAAGSRVDVADIPGLAEVGFHTSDTVMRLDELPRRLAIVGGGYVAAEFAHIFSGLGIAGHPGAPRLEAADGAGRGGLRDVHRARQAAVGRAPGRPRDRGGPQWPRTEARSPCSPSTTAPRSRPTSS